MDGSGSTAGSRGAYAPVTVAISPGNEKIPQKQGTWQQTGLCGCSFRKLLILAGIFVVVIIIIIIIAVVAGNANRKGAPSSFTNNATTVGMAMTKMTASTTEQAATTEPQAATTVSTTMAAPVQYSVGGSVTVNKLFPDYYDDVMDTEYIAYVSDFATSMASLLSSNAQISTQYNRTDVSLSKNVTLIQGDFIVYLNSRTGDPSAGVCQFLDEQFQRAQESANTSILAVHTVVGYLLTC